LGKNSFFPLKKALGFTLIELITVIGVMAILATIGIAALDPMAQFQKSTDARKKSDLSQIQKALETYYGDASSYPENPITVGDYRIKSNDVSGTTIDWGMPWQPYMNILPKAPDSTNYVYYVSDDRQAYYLYASLSRGGKDPQACHADGSKCDNAPVDASCGGICNYGATSSNVNP
jgi:prepilin-type N-terminal cleavage/methylation domain-containing protein